MTDFPLPSGRTMTVAKTSVDTNALHERLAAASRLLQSLEKELAEASLVFARSGSSLVEVVPIRTGITVGRGSDCAVCLGKCADLSRRHFSVRPESGEWLLEDAGSRNGTFVNGVEERITRRLLRDGDIIFAGDLQFLFVNPAD